VKTDTKETDVVEKKKIIVNWYGVGLGVLAVILVGVLLFFPNKKAPDPVSVKATAPVAVATVLASMSTVGLYDQGTVQLDSLGNSLTIVCDCPRGNILYIPHHTAVGANGERTTIDGPMSAVHGTDGCVNK
jgi:hypothetical protein